MGCLLAVNLVVSIACPAGIDWWEQFQNVLLLPEFFNGQLGAKCPVFLQWKQDGINVSFCRCIVLNSVWRHSFVLDSISFEMPPTTSIFGDQPTKGLLITKSFEILLWFKVRTGLHEIVPSKQASNYLD